MKINTGLIRDTYEVNKELNLNHKIKERDDIISIDSCLVEGTLEFEQGELFTNLRVQADLVLASSRSLKPVDYELDFHLHLVFGESEDADYQLEQEIDFSQIIYGHILLEKPLSIYREDELEEENVPKKRKINPAFKDLQDLK